MRFLMVFLIFNVCCLSAQDDLIGREFLKNGEFEKAIVIYNKLYQKNSRNSFYISQLVKAHQELEQYTTAENLLKKRLELSIYPPFLVELGYNYQLQKDTINARLYYNKAITSLNDYPNFGSTVGRNFENHALFNEAILAYETTMKLKPNLNFNLQLARIYGSQGKIPKMFNSYLNFGLRQENYRQNIKRFISDFITEDPENENNIILKKTLLKRIQTEPDLYWSDMLSWLFIQQKDFNKAFAQEKALYKRDDTENLSRLMDLAVSVKNEKAYEQAIKILSYIIEETQDEELILYANQAILEIKTEISKPKDYKTIEESYVAILENFSDSQNTTDFKISYAHFLAFYLNNTSKAILTLKKALKQKISSPKKAQVKLELADILVFEERFNEALIYYTQIQRTLKNSKLSQIARFKVAKTSYYKGDFTWAESQLKILKASTSQLTANDALELKLLISDNRQEDSLQVALTQYAKADLYAFQNKTNEAISLLETIKKEHKTKSIIPQTLIKQAELYEKQKKYNDAKANYEFLIANYKESILMDDAVYRLALLNLNQFNLKDTAKKGFETIIFDHADSIYFTDARKQFRQLRGDDIQ